MVVGSSLYKAGKEMKRILEDYSSAGELSEIARNYFEEKGKLRVMSSFSLPASTKWNQDTFEGDAYPAYSWGCNIAEVEVDKLTFEIEVKKVTASFDVGTIINPMLSQGQVEGGLLQALGYGVMEKMGIKDGKFDADRMQTYAVPTTMDIPEFDINFVEVPYEPADPGAKGLGEIPLNGLAAAIGNAIRAATGTRIRDLPITPEKLFSARLEEG